jgi:hypothetical protein
MVGGVITDAKILWSIGKPAVSMQMNGQGAKMGRINRRAYTKKK